MIWPQCAVALAPSDFQYASPCHTLELRQSRLGLCYSHDRIFIKELIRTYLMVDGAQRAFNYAMNAYS